MCPHTLTNLNTLAKNQFLQISGLKKFSFFNERLSQGMKIIFQNMPTFQSFPEQNESFNNTIQTF